MRVSVDLRDVTVREAARRLSNQIKRPITVDADVADTARVSVRADNVPLATVLDLVSQAAGARWASELVREGSGSGSAASSGGTGGNASSNPVRFQTRYRIGKSVPLVNVPGTPRVTLRPPGAGNSNDPAVHLYSDLLRDGILYSTTRREQRATFTCPHCKRQATVVRRVETPKCPKCERTFQSSWQFCPNDGTKRPASQSAWQYCPFCSRRVSDAVTAETPAWSLVRSPIG